jgi:hypothetical protein
MGWDLHARSIADHGLNGLSLIDHDLAHAQDGPWGCPRTSMYARSCNAECGGTLTGDTRLVEENHVFVLVPHIHVTFFPYSRVSGPKRLSRNRRRCCLDVDGI